MTLESIQAALASDRSISDWKISERRRVSSEAYAIGTELDLSRSVEALDFRVTVYADAGEGELRRRGEATVSIHPTMSDAELERILKKAVSAARPVNPWFPLPEPARWTALPTSGFESRPAAAWMLELMDAIRSAKPNRSRLNSFELYLTRSERRIRNSRGVDASFVSWKGSLEHTVEARGPAGDIELTDVLSFSEPDMPRLSAAIARALNLAEDRARAEPMPSSLDLPLVLSDCLAEETLRWFFLNLDAGNIYSGSSPLAPGGPLHGQDAVPGDYDPITLTAESRIEGAPESSPVDEDGLPLARAVLAKAGTAIELHGKPRYAHYLGRAPVGAYSLFSVEPGSMDEAPSRGFPRIEAAAFSSYDIDPNTGEFGGEIRLAYVCDGQGRRPVTGGSITGSLLENRSRMRMSRDIGLSESMLGPRALLLPSVSIAGAR